MNNFIRKLMLKSHKVIAIQTVNSDIYLSAHIQRHSTLNIK